ncbi:MAG: ABC transporter permease [Bacteriovorax sp.]|nr:ABC transporter permease [Bacteriovorax sp.]
MKFARTIAMAKKEVFHITRDPFTLALALLLPVMMVTIFGLAIEFNVRNIKIAVYDGDKTQSSRKLIDTLSSSHYFLVNHSFNQKDAIHSIDSEKDRAALIIEKNFEYNLLSERGANAQLMIDGADNSTVGSVTSYFGRIENIAAEKITGKKRPNDVVLKTRFLYNPELNSRWFIVPGLMVVVVAILSILLTSLTVAREYENGSMELLLSTPVRPVEIVLGKLTPYIGLGLGAVGFIYIIARVFFGVPFLGSHFIFLGGCLLFLTTYLAQGLLISVTTRKQQISMQFSMMSGLLPSLLLSGFIFPIESMPLFFRVLTAVLPVRWFMEISRDVFLEGSGVYELRHAFLALALICALMVTIAAKKFKRDLEP